MNNTFKTVAIWPLAFAAFVTRSAARIPDMRMASLSLVVLFTVFGQQWTDPVITRLSSVKLFAFGGVGIVGGRTQGETDYDSIMAGPGSRINLEKVFAIGTPEAKMYALVGLQNVVPEMCRALADR